MATLIFIPNDHLLAWIYHAPGVGAARVVSQVRLGAWPFPPDWRCLLDQQFIVPDGTRLLAQAQKDLVVIRANVQLQERDPGHFIPLNPGQAQVLRLMAQGFTTRQMAHAMHMRRRWVKYRVAEIKRRLGAANRAEAVARARMPVEA